MSPSERKSMINRDRTDLSLTKQCKLLKISRSSLYYAPVGVNAETLELMNEIDRVFTKYPFFGSRQIAAYLPRNGFHAGRHRVRRLMGIIGLQAIYKGPNTSKRHPEHRIYPYLLRKLPITRSNHVWCSDITYIPVRRGFLYLVAIMDWATRKVLVWRLSNTLDASFCVEALNEARLMVAQFLPMQIGIGVTRLTRLTRSCIRGPRKTLFCVPFKRISISYKTRLRNPTKDLNTSRQSISLRQIPKRRGS